MFLTKHLQKSAAASDSGGTAFYEDTIQLISIR